MKIAGCSRPGALSWSNLLPWIILSLAWSWIIGSTTDMIIIISRRRDHLHRSSWNDVWQIVTVILIYLIHHSIHCMRIIIRLHMITTNSSPIDIALTKIKTRIILSSYSWKPYIILILWNSLLFRVILLLRNLRYLMILFRHSTLISLILCFS